MLCSIKKFIALLLAIWLPLFSGSALAGAVAMQAKGGDCHAAVTQQHEHRPHHARNTPATTHEHQVQLATDSNLSPDQQDQPNTSCKNHAICHLACCGYVANSILTIVAEQQPDRAFTPYLVTPRTLTLPLFDPPPIARS